MTFALCPYVEGTTPNEVLLTVLAAFTIVYTIIRLVSSSLASSGSVGPRLSLIHEFYGQNPTASYLMDLLFIISYFAVALAIYHSGALSTWIQMPSLRFLAVLAGVIVVLNMSVKFIVDAMVASNPGAHYIQFFAKWADAMGFWAIVWDWLYLGLIATLAFTLIAFGLSNNIWVTAGFWLVVMYYFLTISE